MKKTYFLIVLFLCGLSVGNLFASAAADDLDRELRALIEAEARGDEAKVEELLAEASAAAAAEGDLGQRLREAVREGNEEEVEELLEEEGADVNAANESGYTALMYAVMRGDENMVKKLLRVSGININAVTSNDYKSALILAAERGHESIVKLLLSEGAITEGAADAAQESGHRLLANMIKDYRSGRSIKAAR